MSPTQRRELEDMSHAENAKEPIAVGNELESLELNSGNFVLCGDEVAKPGEDVPGSHVWELCTPEIETATLPSVVCLSDVSYVGCSLSGIHEETPGAADSAIVTEECSKNRVQKYNQAEHKPHVGGISESSTSCTVMDIKQEAQGSGETNDMMGLFICTEHDMRGHVIDLEASDSVSSLGTHSRQKRKRRESHSLVKNSSGSRKSRSVCDTSHVEQKSRWVKRYRTRSIDPTEDTDSNVVADMQEFNLKNTHTGITELHLQCVDKTEPSPSRYLSLNDATSTSFRMAVAGSALCDVLDFAASSGVQHKKRMYV
jgi:hypothetical protein